MGNMVGNRKDVTMEALPIHFNDTLKCHSLSLVMTGGWVG